MREKSDSTRPVPGIVLPSNDTTTRFLCIALLSNHCLKDWTAPPVWSLSTLTFKNPASTPLANPRPASNLTLTSSMSSSNTIAHRQQSFWHDFSASKKSHGVMQHTRSPCTKNVWISSSGIPPILSTPCSTTILATTRSPRVWRRAVTVFRLQQYGDLVSVWLLCCLYLILSLICTIILYPLFYIFCCLSI